ncbi:MAG: alpha/beta hydrolase family esterase [Flammeovirgaceae bacterium]
MLARIILSAFLTSLLSCQSEDKAPEAIPYPVGLSNQQITVNNVIRKFRIHRPMGDSPAALVLVLHGGGGLGTGVADEGAHPLWVFRKLADSENFVAIYPEGSSDVQGNPGWNDCRNDDTSGSQGDDITFLKALVDKLSSEFKLPASKIFVAGTSNGALMSYRFAFHFSSSFRALAISAGNLPAVPESGACASGPVTPIPIMITYGTADPAMPVAGGCVVNTGGQCDRGTVVSQQSTVDFWLQRNGLASTVPSVTSFDLNTTDAGNIDKRVYAGVNPVVIYWMNQAGHSVPSKTVLIQPSSSSGVQNRDIEFAEEAWIFFKTYL